MNLDPTLMFGAVSREVAAEERDGHMARVAVATRSYDTTIEDLWDAITTIERIPRWFLPVTGELRLGGRYQLEGNAGGTVTACDAPQSFAATWEFMGEVSWVEVNLTARPEGGTTLRLKHAAVVDDDRWQQFGPGAVGVGWELGLLGLQLHIETGVQVDSKAFEEWSISGEGKQFVRLSAEDWGKAAIAGGDDPEQATAAAERTAGFYTGELDEPMQEIGP